MEIVLYTVLTLIIPNVQGTSNPNDLPISQQADVPSEPLSLSEFSEAENIILYDIVRNKSSEEPLEKAGLFEGDIVLNSKHNEDRNAIANPNHKWPGGIVPYLISPIFSRDDRVIIARAIMEFERQTCIQFRPRSSERDYIVITTGDGCSSAIGRFGGPQNVSLDNGCVHTGIVMHELNHVVGFWHEQERTDRDDYVTIHLENVKRGTERNFEKLKPNESQTLGAQYDTSSIMDYGPFAFTKSRKQDKRTITPKVPNDRMGQRQNFTKTDIYKINKLYNCPSNTKNIHDTKTDNTTELPLTENSGPCENDNEQCEDWAAQGECSKSARYMHNHCEKACKRC